MAFKIYTKTGDGGETALLGGTRVAKNHIRIESYGTVDELNSWIGKIKDNINESLKSELYDIQNYLFTLGSHLATDPSKDSKFKLPSLQEEQIGILEAKIDAMELALPALKNFVLPGGHPVSSDLHIARCVCRRAERTCVALSQCEETPTHIIQYFNRLSDYLFVLSRYVVYLNKGDEIIWNPST
jgi:cob(I)alamin adenosyltransferase